MIAKESSHGPVVKASRVFVAPGSVAAASGPGKQRQEARVEARSQQADAAQPKTRPPRLSALTDAVGERAPAKSHPARA